MAAARKRRKTKSARRVGGGVKALGEIKMSSRLSAGLPEGMCVRLALSPEMSLADLALRDRVRQAVTLPAFRQPKQFRFWHLNDREHLAAFGDQHVIRNAANLERAPETDAIEPVEPAPNAQTIPELGRAPIIDFGAND